MASATISVDTFYSQVAREAVYAGAHIVNDVSGGTLDAAMLAEVKDPLKLAHNPSCRSPVVPGSILKQKGGMVWV